MGSFEPMETGRDGLNFVLRTQLIYRFEQAAKRRSQTETRWRTGHQVWSRSISKGRSRGLREFKHAGLDTGDSPGTCQKRCPCRVDVPRSCLLKNARRDEVTSRRHKS